MPLSTLSELQQTIGDADGEDDGGSFARRWLVVTALAAVATAGLWHYNARHLHLPQSAPATGALIPAPYDAQAIPITRTPPTLQIGEKTKLMMNNDAYLFGSQRPAFGAASGPDYRVGIGREFQRRSGDRLTNEISFPLGDKLADPGGREAAKTRLSTAYLRQLSEQSRLSAGLHADLADDETWSTLELKLHLQLERDVALQLNHDSGRSLDHDAREHQTSISLEKRF